MHDVLCVAAAVCRQAGGKVLDAPAVEITYGLERILMSLQGVKHFKDIRWGRQGLACHVHNLDQQ